MARRLLDTMNYFVTPFWSADVDTSTFSFCPILGGSPMKIMTIVALYVYFVKILGPKMMENRKPLPIKGLIFVYNALMAQVNAIFFVTLLVATKFGTLCFGCHRLNYSDPVNSAILMLCYFYALSKIVDLLDTVFFVLRKKTTHVTLLHVHHHATVALLAWLTLNTRPAYSYFMFFILNSLAHTFMYSYYALSTLGPAVQPYLWWKKYITKFQICHIAVSCSFVTISSLIYPSHCTPATSYVAFSVSQGIIMMALFIRFYLKAYKVVGSENKFSNNNLYVTTDVKTD